MGELISELMKKPLAPVVLFVYNRIEHTRITVDALRKNHGANETILYIYSDASKNDADEIQVNEVRNYIYSLEGFKSIEIVKQEKNIGLSKSILLGVTQVVRKHGCVIVLEDDIMTSPYFLVYMNDALDMYKNDDKVYSIHGYMFPVACELPDTFFLAGANSWGWATWTRAWDQFEGDGRKLLAELERRKLTRMFDVNGTCMYTKMLKDQIAGKNDSWAIRWRAKVFLQGGLTLFPRKSLVQNIGHDSTGVHCQTSNIYSVDLNTERVQVLRMEMDESSNAINGLMDFYKKNTKSLYTRIIGRLQRILKDMTS